MARVMPLAPLLVNRHFVELHRRALTRCPRGPAHVIERLVARAQLLLGIEEGDTRAGTCSGGRPTSSTAAPVRGPAALDHLPSWREPVQCSHPPETGRCHQSAQSGRTCLPPRSSAADLKHSVRHGNPKSRRLSGYHRGMHRTSKPGIPDMHVGGDDRPHLRPPRAWQ